MAALDHLLNTPVRKMVVLQDGGRQFTAWVLMIPGGVMVFDKPKDKWSDDAGAFYPWHAIHCLGRPD